MIEQKVKDLGLEELKKRENNPNITIENLTDYISSERAQRIASDFVDEGKTPEKEKAMDLLMTYYGSHLERIDKIVYVWYGGP